MLNYLPFKPLRCLWLMMILMLWLGCAARAQSSQPSASNVNPPSTSADKINVGNFVIACERCADELTAARKVITTQAEQIAALESRVQLAEQQTKLANDQTQLEKDKAKFWEERAQVLQAELAQVEENNEACQQRLAKKGSFLKKVFPYLVGAAYLAGKLGF